jgi:hypothetical protein
VLRVVQESAGCVQVLSSEMSMAASQLAVVREALAGMEEQRAVAGRSQAAAGCAAISPDIAPLQCLTSTC